MQVDHIEAVYLHEKELKAGKVPEINSIENYMPACRACNFYKSTMSIESFRKQLETLPERLEKLFIYRLAKKYGIVQETKSQCSSILKSRKEERAMPKGYYRKRSEATEQERVINWATFYAKDFPELELLHHIPNGGSRNQLEAANLKRQGSKSRCAGLMLASSQKRQTRALR